VRGLVILGTTGETPTLTEKEQEKLLKIAVKRFGGRKDAEIIAGTGTNDTRKSVEKTKKARDMGADAALVVTPYYNKPNPRGLIGHFNAVSEIMPTIVYDIVGRTARQIKTNEFEEILKFENIIGVKAASGDLEQIKEVIGAVRAAHDKSIHVWSGDDKLTVPVMKAGGYGVISVISNLEPGLVLRITANNVFLSELEKLAETLTGAAFVETNPVPIKYMMYLRGLIPSAAVRLPMGELLDASKNKIAEIVKEYQVRRRGWGL
jgi:4-hydroxy-tetrahydrodipicolinate synthase